MSLASAAVPPGRPHTAMLDRAREVENLGTQLSMVAELVNAAEIGVADNRQGDRERAEAILVATGHMIRALGYRIDALVERMLDASEK